MDTWELTPNYSGEPHHIKMYGEGMWRFCTLSSVGQKVLMVLLRQTTVAECGMTILLNATKKSTISKILGVDISIFNSKLRELEEIGIIRIKTQNLYEVNPRMFGKGDWSYISKLQKTWPSCEEV